MSSLSLASTKVPESNNLFEDQVHPVILRREVLDDITFEGALSSSTKFRTFHRSSRVWKACKIHDVPGAQLIVEQRIVPDGNNLPQDQDFHRITIKQVYDRPFGLQLLRAIYSLLAVFVGGFLLVFVINILLYMFTAIIIQLGLTKSRSFSVIDIITISLSFPIFIDGLSIIMVLMSRFIFETFYGHPFLSSLGLNSITKDGISFVMYAGIPIMTLISTLFMKLDNWWEITLLTWFSSVLIVWGIFSFIYVWYGVRECLDLIEWIEEDLSDKVHWSVKIKYAAVHIMQFHLSTRRTTFYETIMDDERMSGEDYLKENSRNSDGLCTHLSKIRFLSSLYHDEVPPKRIYSLNETLGYVSLVSRSSWSLEKIFCQTVGLTENSLVAFGQSRTTESQINSSIMCRFLGHSLYLMMFVAILSWFGLYNAELYLLLILPFCFFLTMSRTTRYLMRLRRDLKEDKNLLRYKEVYQIRKATIVFTKAFMCLEVVFLYLIPILHLAIEKIIAPALVFTILGVISAIHHYLNPKILLQEIGPVVFDPEEHDSSLKIKKKRAKSYRFVEHRNDHCYRVWSMTFIGVIVLFTFVMIVAANSTLSANGTQENYGLKSDVMHLINEFEYKPQPNLPYPTCHLTKGFNTLFDDDLHLRDVAFLARLAYLVNDRIQLYLDQWFQQEGAIHNVQIVDEFKDRQAHQNHIHEDFNRFAVHYKVINFSDSYAFVSVKGTTTVWDVLTDAQLWMPASLFQLLRAMLPFGDIFTPIIHHFVKLLSSLATHNLKHVSYYKETTSFVEYLKSSGYEVKLTGHSLGGGLALITGAQTNTTAVVISAPNALLSRKSFYPPVTVEHLNTLTLNIVPSRDIVPMIDDKARLIQNINCTASKHDIFGCHGMYRTLCEILFSCGTSNRPVPCDCVLKFKYPEPTPTTNLTTNFTEQCLNAIKSTQE